MNTAENHESVFSEDEFSEAGLLRLCHDAMATTFELYILHPDAQYARQAARASFAEIDRLESELSRFIENSDVSRINARAPEAVTVSLDTLDCLALAEDIHRATGGAFDITAGSVARRSYAAEIDRENKTARLKDHDASIDLGGVGKGYAADAAAAVLKQWRIETALINAGASSLCALEPSPGTNGFPVTLSNPADRNDILLHLRLQRIAVGCSGLQKAAHIIDPRTGKAVTGKSGAWSLASDAATADALSTAFMVMSPRQVEDYCKKHPQVSAMLLLAGSGGEIGQKLLRFGRWPQ